MKVILEAQYAWSPNPRGLHHYAIQMIRTLLKRKAYDYELTFFDYNRECGNRARIDKHFGEYNIPIHECNTLDYRVASSDRDIYKDKSYNDYTGAYGDIFHFFSMITVPDNLKGDMVVTIHDVIPLIYPELCDEKVNRNFRVALERLERVQPTVIADSAATKEDILKFTSIPCERVFVIPLGFDKADCPNLNHVEVLRQIGIDFPYLLYLGGIGGHKNVKRIVDAFELIAEKHPGLRLIIAGKPEPHANREVFAIENSRFYKTRVIMPGYVSDEQKHALYSGAVAFVFPSLYEGFGLPVLEAMACGCPVITSNVSSLPEVAGDAAIMVNPYDTEQLAHEMESVITSGVLREDLRVKGLEQSEKFSWDKAAEMVERVYRFAYEQR